MQFSKEIMKGAAEIIVLRTLQSEGESYGYQLIKAIRSTSQNIFEFQEGTLYPLLYRLESKGYVTSKIQLAPSGKERRYYTITRKGLKQLKEVKVELGVFTKGLNKLFNFSS